MRSTLVQSLVSNWSHGSSDCRTRGITFLLNLEGSADAAAATTCHRFSKCSTPTTRSSRAGP